MMAAGRSIRVSLAFHTHQSQMLTHVFTELALHTQYLEGIYGAFFYWRSFLLWLLVIAVEEMSRFGLLLSDRLFLLRHPRA